jgi:hypothetical protein
VYGKAGSCAKGSGEELKALVAVAAEILLAAASRNLSTLSKRRPDLALRTKDDSSIRA